MCRLRVTEASEFRIFINSYYSFSYLFSSSLTSPPMKGTGSIWDRFNITLHPLGRFLSNMVTLPFDVT